MLRVLLQHYCYLFFACLSLLCLGLFSCGDADSITTPRSIETTLKRYTLRDSAIISPKQITIISDLNRKEIKLIAMSELTTIRILQFADSSWGIDGSALLVASQQGQDSLFVDTLAFRCAALRSDDGQRDLDASLSSSLRNAAFSFFHTQRFSPIDTSDTSTTSISIRRLGQTDFGEYDSVIVIKHTYSRDSVRTDTTRTKAFAFTRTDSRTSANVQVKTITKHTGVKKVARSLAFHPGKYEGQILAPVISVQEQDKKLIVHLVFESKGVKSIEDSLGSFIVLNAKLYLPLP